MKRTVKYIMRFTMVGLTLSGCLSDNILEPVNFAVIHSVELLRYLESKGDVFNSINTPFLVSATEVFLARTNYLKIDIRPSIEYARGHIESSINLQNTELLEYLKGITPSNYIKIVIVSSTGQAAAYYTCLLRLYGFENIYCMNYGMASWNRAFAHSWLAALGSINMLGRFNNVNYPKSTMGSFPDVAFSNEAGSVEEILDERISMLMNEIFVDTLHHEVNSRSIIMNDAIAVMNGEYIDGEIYLICYGDPGLYYFGSQSILEGDGHFTGTVLYSGIAPYYEFRSDKFLHTIPSEKSIIIYSYNGHLSAAAAAYLNTLGYNAKSVLFGGNNLFYPRMINRQFDWLLQWAFLPEEILNYPYVFE